MPSPTTISIDKLARLVGTPNCPALIDVRTDEDFASDPRLIPGSIRRPHDRVQEWSGSIATPSAVIVCQGGKKLSEGVAAWLRQVGKPAEALEGGHEAWIAARLPTVISVKIPKPDAAGRTVWVTRSRPKIDRIACPWLIRRQS
ncbi:MAG: sulfurtransferase, partial [Rhizobiaceae bacterium]